MKSRINVTVLFLALLLMVIPSPAKEKPGTKKGLSKVTAGQPYLVVNGNNVTSFTRSDGYYPAIIANSWNGEYPKGSGVGNIYQEGIVFGGFVRDGLYPNDLRVTGDTYYIGMQPGALNADGTYNPADAGAASARAFKVRGDMPPSIENDPAAWPDLTPDAASYNMIPQASVTDAMKSQIAAQYFQDWKEWPAAKGAPWYVDTVKQVRYDAAYDYTNKHDIPGIPGATNTLWYLCNDANGPLTGQFAGSPPIGMEEQMTMWSYASSTPLNNIIFKQVKLIYKGNPNSPPTSKIDSMYVVQWADGDDGDAGDDYAGSDSLLNLNYEYNSTTIDAKYAAVGLPCPAVGYCFLNGVAHFTGQSTDSAVVGFGWKRGYAYWHTRNGVPTPLTSAVYFAAGTSIQDPDNAVYAGTQQWFNLMRGDLPRPPYPDGIPFYQSSGYASDHGIVTQYALSGDPVTGEGWIDGIDISASDRRIVTTHGPFTMNKGDTAEVVVALVDGIGADNIGSVKVLKYNTTYAQFAFNNNFNLPSPPPSPKTSMSQLDGKIVLNWGGDAKGADAIESSDNNGFKFEGYNVYQLPSASSTIDQGVRIATYDIVDNVTVIVAPALDQTTGVIVSKPVEFGSDKGISRSIVLTQDYLKQRPLVNGTVYYFAVTAYSYNVDWENPASIFQAPFPSLESAPVAITAEPAAPKPGLRYGAGGGDSLAVSHTNAAGSPSDGVVTAVVVQPDLLTGDTYRVLFDSVGSGWTIVDVTKGNTVKLAGTNQSGDANYLTVDGVQVIVYGPPPSIKSFTYTGDRWITGVNWGGGVFFGGADIGANFFGSDLNPPDYVPVEMQWTANTTVGGTGWSQGAVYRRDKGYAYEGIGWMPFTVWDISNPASPRQINACFVEDSASGSANLQWDMGWDGTNFKANGGREYIFINKTSYDPTHYNASIDGTSADCLYAIWPAQRGTQTYLEGAFTITIKPNYANTPADQFTYTAPAPSYNLATAQADVNKINVFPNPYYGVNQNETNRLSKYVRFTHLPAGATIRIFTLAGVLVRTLPTTDGTSTFTDWNLRNENSLPVASGIYIAFIDMPSLGKTKTLKIAVVQEDEILPTY